MAAEIYLAMTGAEFSSVSILPDKIGWMACQFSPYGFGLTNLPASLPEGSLLILNDQIPFQGHDIRRIRDQLEALVETFGCSAVLMDFQRKPEPETLELAGTLVSSLPCPVTVSEEYAAGLPCSVFLSPCPHHTPLEEHIAPWAGRELWLDLAVDGETITLTKQGASIVPLPLGELPEGGHQDSGLHCHYSIQTSSDSARFTLWRTKEDLDALSREADWLGIHTLVGLYQELR